MEYQETIPCDILKPYIHSFWKLDGGIEDRQWERNFPDGCGGLVINMGDTCVTDNGAMSMEFGKTYVVGAMTAFKDSFISADTRLMGVCLKPAAFSAFYRYAPQDQLLNQTIEFDAKLSFDPAKMLKNPLDYLNTFFAGRITGSNSSLQLLIDDIDKSGGRLGICELASKNNISVRKLERDFKLHVGLSPKEYSNIVRFQRALSIIKNPAEKQSLLDIAFECGFYDHAHLGNEIKRYTGFAPTGL